MSCIRSEFFPSPAAIPSRSCPAGGVKGFGRRFPRRPASLRKESTSVSKRVSPAGRLRAEIDGVFVGGEDLVRAIERVAQLGARLLLQSALEAEVAAFWARDAMSGPPPAGGPGRDAQRV